MTRICNYDPNILQQKIYMKRKSKSEALSSSPTAAAAVETPTFSPKKQKLDWRQEIMKSDNTSLLPSYKLVTIINKKKKNYFFTFFVCSQYRHHQMCNIL